MIEQGSLGPRLDDSVHNGLSVRPAELRGRGCHRGGRISDTRFSGIEPMRADWTPHSQFTWLRTIAKPEPAAASQRPASSLYILSQGPRNPAAEIRQDHR